MVGPERFELSTSCTPCKRATRLRYGPTKERAASRMARWEASGFLRVLAESSEIAFRLWISSESDPDSGSCPVLSLSSSEAAALQIPETSGELRPCSGRFRVFDTVPVRSHGSDSAPRRAPDDRPLEQNKREQQHADHDAHPPRRQPAVKQDRRLDRTENKDT